MLVLKHFVVTNQVVDRNGTNVQRSLNKCRGKTFEATHSALIYVSAVKTIKDISIISMSAFVSHIDAHPGVVNFKGIGEQESEGGADTASHQSHSGVLETLVAVKLEVAYLVAFRWKWHEQVLDLVEEKNSQGHLIEGLVNISGVSSEQRPGTLGFHKVLEQPSRILRQRLLV